MTRAVRLARIWLSAFLALLVSFSLQSADAANFLPGVQGDIACQAGSIVCQLQNSPGARSHLGLGALATLDQVDATKLAAGAVAGNLGFTPLSPSNNLSEITNRATALANLGALPQFQLFGDTTHGNFGNIIVVGPGAGPLLSNLSVASIYMGNGAAGGGLHLDGCPDADVPVAITGAENATYGWGNLTHGTTAAFTSLFGIGTGACLVTGTNDDASGTDAMRDGIDLSFDVIHGFAAMRNPTNGVNRSVAEGAYACQGTAASTGNDLLCMGFSSLANWVNAFADSCVGSYSCSAVTNSDHIWCAGTYACTNLTIGQYVSCSGAFALANEVTNGQADTCNGFESLYNANGSSKDVADGAYSLLNCTLCSGVSALGWSAGEAATIATNSLFLGQSVQSSGGAFTGAGVVVIGTGAQCNAPSLTSIGSFTICANGGPFLIGQNGSTPSTGSVRSAGTLGTNGYTVADLGTILAPHGGDMAWVSNATACSSNSVPVDAGAGGVPCKVWYAATQWLED